MNKQAITKRIIGLITAMLTVSIAVPAYTQEQGSSPVWTGDGTSDSPYQVSSQEDLAAFRTAVNGGETYEGKNFILTASFTVDNWTESIGGIPNDNTPFSGTFDGQGYVITMTGSASLFARIGMDGSTIGTVKNLGVAGTLNNTSNDNGAQSIGSIATENYGTIEQCYTSATISSGYGFAGGIADANKGTIRNCYSTGAITSSTRSAGGIASTNSADKTIQNCYSTGAVTASTNTDGIYKAGGIAGNNRGSIQNCIALNASISGSSIGRIAGANDSGTLTDNYASPTITGTWSEDVINGTALTADNFTGQTAGQGAFANWSDDNWDFTNTANLPILKDFKGDPAQPTIVRPTIAPALIKEIKDADDLAAFRDAVNSGETYEGETVTLTNDITVTDWEAGIGIEADNKPFSGIFDGQGHVINLAGSTSLFALIGKANETYGTVKNLGVNAEITANTTNTGGIVGHNYGTIQNCYTKGTITNDSYYTGGIVGDNGGTIRNCYSTALCTGNNNTGGIVGKHSGTILQCYATGAINGELSAGGIAGTFGGNKELKNCIALNTSITFTDTEGKSGRIISSPTAKFLSNNHASPLLPGTLMEAEKKDGADLTKENFIDETTATGVFAEWPTGDDGWDLTTPSLPTLKVFKDENNPQPAKGITRKAMLMKLTIDSADDLIKFRDAVAGGEKYTGLTVKLTADITVEDWTDPIGTTDNSFLGTFDGGGHVITLTGSTSLFRYVSYGSDKDAIVKNLGVKAKITTNLNNSIGAIAAFNYGTIQNCFTEGSITSSNTYPGGIAGQNYGTIEDCYSTASVETSASTTVGGIVGNNTGTIQRCYATGTIKNTYSSFGGGAGGIVGSNATNGTIKNCIALNTSITVTGSTNLGRIACKNYNTNTNALADNYASPLIPGEWTGKGATYLNGADLTTANFITPTGATGAFAEWPTGDTGWDLTTDNLPTLKGFKAAQSVAGTTRVSKTLILSIASADDLGIFRTVVAGGETYEEKTVTLTGDITVEKWEKGIGVDNKPFLGTFDGAGHIITLTGKTSLFTTLGEDGEEKGTVQNLGVKVKIEATDDVDGIGGIANTNYGTIKQCYTTGEISGDWVGGIVVQNHNRIQDCYSTVSVKANSGAGGIAQNNFSEDAVIERCFVTGAISGGNDATGGIAGVNNGSITKCIALNKSIEVSEASSDLGRIIGSNDGDKAILADNFASPLIPGEWSSKEGDDLDGADLTDDNFIDKGVGVSVFTDWQVAVWDFTDADKLPKLKTTENIVIGGQGDDSGNMPARTNFLEQVIEISTSVTYDEATHKGKQIRVTNGGIFTITADGTFKKLTIEEGGQVVANAAFTCKELLAPHRTLGNKWTAYGSPVNMSVVAETSQKFYRLSGYKNTGNQSWSSDGSTIGTSFSISTLNLVATEADNVSVTLKAPVTGNDTIPVDGTATTGSALNTGTFLFCPNPTLKNVTIPVAYILSDDGTRFERTADAIVKPFQSYVVANAATSNAVMSLRVGETPTANGPISLPDAMLRIWGNNGVLHLATDSPADVSVYNTAGQLIRHLTLTGEQTLSLPRGIYLVHSNNITYKVSL